MFFIALNFTFALYCIVDAATDEAIYMYPLGLFFMYLTFAELNAKCEIMRDDFLDLIERDD